MGGFNRGGGGASVVFLRLLGQHSRVLLIFLGEPAHFWLGLLFIVKSFYLWLFYVNGTFF